MSDGRIILIVDDSLISRLFMKKAVEASYPDWKIIEAGNAQEALASVEDNPISIALLDLNMPGGINGLALAKTLQDSQDNIQIALVTANVQMSIQEKADSLGVAFVAKPVTEDKITAFLEQCLA